VEARLTDRSCAAPLDLKAQVDLGVDGSIFLPPVDSVSPRSRLLARIDRYLQAAGVDDEAARARLATNAARDLLAMGLSAEANWAEVVAAIDRSLAAELAPEGMTLPRARGRVALGMAGGLSGVSTKAMAGLCGPDWGAPPRSNRVMRAQDLSPWRPSLRGLLRLQVSRPAQGLAACLCWLAVLFVP
jgi:hypothetical protein